MHVANHSTCAIRSVKHVQVSSLCETDLLVKSCYLMFAAKTCEFSTRPVCAMAYKYTSLVIQYI